MPSSCEQLLRAAQSGRDLDPVKTLDRAVLAIGAAHRGDLGDSGKVRVQVHSKGAMTLPYLLWKTDGTAILLDVPPGETYRSLTLEMSNGKLTYEVSGQTPNLLLGREKINNEFADLFHDDKNPKNPA